MRRYRFGLPAYAVATLYVALALVLAVIGVIRRDAGPAWSLVVDRIGFLSDGFPRSRSLLVPIVGLAVVQGWAYFHVLRGRLRGEPARHGRAAGLLRLALYLTVGYTLLFFVPLDYPWWTWLSGDVLQAATAVLFFVVLRGTAPRWLRLAVLLGGLFVAAHDAAASVVSGLGVVWTEPTVLGFATQYGRPVWLALVLVAQGRDPRWSPATVRVGAAALVVSAVQPSGFLVFSYPSEFPWRLLFLHLTIVLSVFSLAWTAMSAHDLGSPQPPRPLTVRMPVRRWPLPALAVLLPLLPAAANLARGVPYWLGPHNGVWWALREFTMGELLLLWVGADLLVGVGGAALLVLAAVLRRTRRAVRLAVLVLLAMAGAGAVGVATPGRTEDVPGIYASGDGISPLWFALALAGSALLLHLLYSAPRERRSGRQVLAAGLAGVLVLALLPVADQSRGPSTTREACAAPRTLTADQKVVCTLRGPANPVTSFSDTVPDQVVLAYARRMCGVHTRNDPKELAALHVTRTALSFALADSCPGAAAVRDAAIARENQEVAAIEAEERRMCASIQRHRPLIRPARVVRVREALLTDFGMMQTSELEEAMGDDDGLVSSDGGTLSVNTSPDLSLCVTVESYARRPPVETKGWDQVVEVGYTSPTGKILLADPMGGDPLPNLALDGRKGHYRIRVHYGLSPWKGEPSGGQRLLIMAYPGRGDKEIVYR